MVYVCNTYPIQDQFLVMNTYQNQSPGPYRHRALIINRTNQEEKTIIVYEGSDKVSAGWFLTLILSSL